MGQVLSFILKLLRWKQGKSKVSRDDTHGHVDDDQSQSQSRSHFTLPVQVQRQQEASESCIDIIIDHPHVDDLLSVPISHNQTTNPAHTIIRTSDVTTSKTLLVTKRIGPYTSSQTILLVGEGDFSFSACLALAFGSASNMVATSLNTFDFLLTNYGYFATNKKKLVTRGCIVLHGIDATKMATHPQLSSVKFDRIVFNFPHSGFGSEEESTHSEIGRHLKLVSGFLRNAKQMINENGQIHIRHKCNVFFLKWNIPKLASDQGLLLIQEAKFQRSMFPGYHTKYGFGGDKDFNCNPSKTYMFGLTDGYNQSLSLS